MDNSKVGEVLNASHAYEIPPYQRNYQWDRETWQGLVSDVLGAATSSREGPPHWLGIILLSEREDSHFPRDFAVREYSVIDGQQRLVTLAVWLAALVHHAADHGQPVGLDVTKLAPIRVQESDKKPFEVAIHNQWRDPQFMSLLEAEGSSPLLAYRYFRWILWLGEDAMLRDEPVALPRRKRFAPEQSFENQWTLHVESPRGKETPRGNPLAIEELVEATLERLSLHILIHQPKLDEAPAVVFDTLNGARTPLEPLDHVRNSLFIRISSRKQAAALYEHDWEQHETNLRRVPVRRLGPSKLFLYDYVISKGEKKRQKSLNANRGAAQFAAMTRTLKDDGLVQFVRNDVIPAMAAWPVAMRHTDQVVVDNVLTQFTTRACQLMTSIQDLSGNPANPIVLHYLVARVRGKVTDAELEQALFLTEDFLVRQLLVARPLSPLRSKVMEIMGDVDDANTVSALRGALGKRDWVTNQEILKGCRDRRYYGELTAGQLGAIFRGIERKLGEGPNFFKMGNAATDYTIEHIYPQEPKLWKPDLSSWKGADAGKMNQLVDTLGNLTVVTFRHNQKVGHKTFAAKKEYPDTLGNAAPLNLNKDWLHAKKWTQEEIVARTAFLIGQALDYWKGP